MYEERGPIRLKQIRSPFNRILLRLRSPLRIILFMAPRSHYQKLLELSLFVSYQVAADLSNHVSYIHTLYTALVQNR